MTDTPRTDEVDDRVSPDTNGHKDWKFAYFHMLTLSKQLERENDAYRADSNTYCKILSILGMEEEGDPVEAITYLKVAAGKKT